MKWLKTFFKKAAIEEYNIPLERLFDWFIERSMTLIDEEKQQLREKLRQLQGARSVLKDKLKLLGEAQLMNAALPEKEKQIMFGNREAYLRTVSAFADGLVIPDELAYEKLLQFISGAEERMGQLVKNTARNYIILKEFFSNEVRDGGNQLTAIEGVFAGLKQTKLAELATIKKKINELEETVKQKGGFADTIIQEKQALALTESLIASAETHMQQLRTGKQFQELELLQKQMAALKGKLKNHHDLLSKSFSSIERLIRKYCAAYPEEARLFQSYLTNAGDALLADTNVLIVDGLDRLRGTILTGQFGTDDKERHDSLARLNELSVEHLKNTAALMEKINEQILDVYKRIRLNNVQREIEELEYKTAHLKTKHAAGIVKVKKAEKKETKDDISTLREGAEDAINAFLGMPINILIDGDDKESGDASDSEGE